MKKDMLKNIVIGVLVIVVIGMAGDNSNTSNTVKNDMSVNNELVQASNSIESAVEVEDEVIESNHSEYIDSIIELGEQENNLVEENQESQNSSSAQASTSVEPQLSPPQSQTTNSYTVYITRTGDKYHRGTCSYLRQSKIEIDKDDAIAKGYTPCSRCNP